MSHPGFQPADEGRSEFSGGSPATPVSRRAYSRRRLITLASRGLGLVLLAALTAGAPWYAERVSYSIAKGRSQAEVDLARRELSGGGVAPAVQSRLVAQSVRPSVVRIRSRSVTTPAANAAANSDHDAGRPSREYRFTEGEGSGVVIDEEGFIVTNLHVVGEHSEVEVLLSDGRRRDARLVGTDSLTDLALLQVKAGGLIPAAWGSSRDLAEGDWVWAVGSPFGLDQSITFGIVSAKGRRAKAGSPHQDFLQTDAAVNPGNSGGPLVNVRGEVVGINTAIVGDAYQGVSFAVPSEIAERVVRQLKENGHVERGWLGVKMQTPLTGATTENSGPGVVIASVQQASPAEAAGLLPGDRIVKWGGQPILTNSDLSLLVSLEEIGAAVDVQLVRAEEQVACHVEVGVRPSFD